jgi:hypothetical protein
MSLKNHISPLGWRKSYVHILVGTKLELHPEAFSDWWFVVETDGSKEKVLSSAMPLKQAKKRAMEIAKGK